MDVKNLKTLLAIVDHHSFSAAGEVVGLSPSGVSLQIKALEDEFGLALFDRTTRPPQLTEEGVRFAARAREAVLHWEKLTEAMSADSIAGVLKLGAIPTLVSGILPLALKRLRQVRPDLRIHLTTGLSHKLHELLHKGTLDAAISVQPENRSAYLDWQPYTSEPLAVIMPSDIVCDDDRKALSLNPYIRFESYAWVGRIIDAELTRRNIKVNTTMEVDTLDGVFGLVANGLGVSIVPWRNIAQPFPANVRAIRFGDPVVSRELGILQRYDNPRRHLVDELFDVLINISKND